MILYLPRPWRRASSAPARHVDVLPTILDALSLPVPEGLGPQPAARRGGKAGAVRHAELLRGPVRRLNRGWALLHGVIRDGVKYVDLPVPELYDLRSDPREGGNLAAAEPSRAEPLRAPRAFLAGHAAAGVPRTWRRGSGCVVSAISRRERDRGWRPAGSVRTTTRSG